MLNSLHSAARSSSGGVCDNHIRVRRDALESAIPPPPPNQIVFVELPAAMRLPSVYDAVWITGTLRTQIKNSQLGTAANTLEATKVENYDFEPH
jgi:hypothetical protein